MSEKINSVDVAQTRLAQALTRKAEAVERLAFVQMQIAVYRACSKRLSALLTVCNEASEKESTCRRIARLEKRWDRELDRLENK